jgi:penicillin-binding protein 1C
MNEEKRDRQFGSGWKRVAKGVMRIVLEFVYILLLVVVGTAIAFVGLYRYKTPEASTILDVPLAETSYIYDRTGEVELYRLYGEENRIVLSHDEIPDVMRAATVAAEDESFYTHFGIDIPGIIRAFFVNVEAGEIRQGGSTITQQLARSAFYDRERTFRRKMLESVMAVKLEQAFTKDEILDMYLNRVPYGANAYGVGSAARIYFGKEASELLPDEAALLAALPKAPSLLSPYTADPDMLVIERNTVLERMEVAGQLSGAEGIASRLSDTIGKIRPFRQSVRAPHFVFSVLEELEHVYGRETLEEGGWDIITTLDMPMQELGERVVAEGRSTYEAYGAENAALVALDPEMGEVLAMVGSRDFFDTSIDGEVNVSTRPRQPGSSFKPIVYATAFEKGFQPETLLVDKRINFGPDGSGEDYIPENYDGQFRGMLSMRETLAQSLNVPAVETLYLADIDWTIDMAERLGITTLGDPSRYGLALALGAGEVRLLDMVSAFGTFAADGVHASARSILRIENASGKRIDHDPPVPEYVIDPQVARKVASILSDNAARTPTFGPNSPLILSDRPVAAKTGTTQDFRDAWTIGFTPSLAVGVWAGNNDNHPMDYGAAGLYVAAPLWRTFMTEATASEPIETFPDYERVESDKPMLAGKRPYGDVKYYDLHSGKELSPETAANRAPGDVRVKAEYSGRSILSFVSKDDPLGDTPPDYDDPMLWRWEEGYISEEE